MDGIALSGRDLLDQIASFHVFMKNETFLSECGTLLEILNFAENIVSLYELYSTVLISV